MSLPSRTLDTPAGSSVSQHALPVPARSSAHAVARKAPGLHLIGDLYDCVCDSRLMFDAAHLEDFCKRQVQAAGLNAVGSLFHSFGDEGGVTGVVVLAESHLSIHTWPEDGYVTLDVYVCSYSTDNSGKAQDLFERLMRAFNPAEPHLHRVVRA